jgi:hypothetical protein
MTIFEEIPSLSPVQFFDLAWDCPYIKKALKVSSDSRLPSTSELLNEDSFADIYMGWNEEGIYLEIRSQVRTLSDTVELFFDTRNLKTKARISRFCHQFSFTPDEKEGFYGREITRFQNDDVHRLSDPHDLEVKVESTERSYRLQIQIPAHCLYGYDPLQFTKLGFTYRIIRADGSPQHFAVSTEEFVIEQHPSLWATLNLVGFE